MKSRKLSIVMFFFLGVFVWGCLSAQDSSQKDFVTKGDVVGIIKEDEEVTIILETDNVSRIFIGWGREEYEELKGILASGNRVKITARFNEEGDIQGVSAERIARILKSKLQSINGKALSAYKNTIRYFNPDLTDKELTAIASNILTYSKLNRLDPRLVIAVIAVESCFDINALSVKGAIGLGQLMPGTAEILNVNPYKLEENILGTAMYLRRCLDLWKGYPYMSLHLGLASYNAGPHAVEKYGGIPPYTETQNFVERVLDIYIKLCKSK